VIQDARLVRHSGSSQSVVIPRTIEVFGNSYFQDCVTLTSIAFENESKLIESKIHVSRIVH
jgi:hypothetical protein